MVSISISSIPPQTPITGLMVFLAFGFPYVLVVIMAYVGARIVYNLGTEVTRARELGSYRLENRLGVGGMGEVWRASHRLLARPAAIKLIKSPEPGTLAGIPDDDREPTFSGSSDMGNVSQVLPTIHPYLAICDKGVPGHSIEFRDAAASARADEVALQAATITAQTAWDLFADPSLVEAAWAEFRGREGAG